MMPIVSTSYFFAAGDVTGVVVGDPDAAIGSLSGVRITHAVAGIEQEFLAPRLAFVFGEERSEGFATVAHTVLGLLAGAIVIDEEEAARSKFAQMRPAAHTREEGARLGPRLAAIG